MKPEPDGAIVLVVDDNDDVRQSVIGLLAAYGYEGTGAVDGGHAMSLLRSGLRPCLILLDLRMPGQNGWQFREAQLKDERLAAIPTVTMSSEGAFTQLSGLAGSLPKPIPVDQLLALVKKHCS